MFSYEASGTPCPIAYGSDAISESYENESTFNFTSAFRPSLQHAKARRPRSSVAFAIHDDNFGENEGARFDGRESSDSMRRKGPRQRQVMQNHLEGMPASQDQMASTIYPLRSSRLAQAPKRPTVRPSTITEYPSKSNESVKNEKASPKPSRPARRGTLYIPSEDTTMPSMYMGIFSPIKNYNSRAEEQSVDQPLMDMTGIAAQMAVKRGSRKSIISAAPRRAPLQPPSRIAQETATAVDRQGQGGGKENVPPGFEECEKLMLALELDGIKEAPLERKLSPRRTVRAQPQRAVSSNTMFAPTASSLNRSNPGTCARASPVQQPSNSNYLRATWNSGNRQRSCQVVPVPPKHQEKLPPTRPTNVVLKAKVPSRFVIPAVKPEPIINNYALLSEDIARPDMYEENWLSHQEIAITQLVNSLFDSTISTSTYQCNSGSLRQQLLDVYATDGMPLIYNRLNAALLYGALGIPREVLDHGESLYKDMGRKQRFLDLWLQTYNHDSLEVALEVVIGRQCRSAAAIASNPSSLQPVSKKALQTFIEAFLLRNEDATPDTEATASWSYQRTMHRSLMLIKLLDLIKTDSSITTSTCLFQPTSSFKSSTAVVQSLFQMLNTSAGDPLRALGHINYHVSHVQAPLEEFTYKIENLAVDLRDGTRLTRLVEILLYPSTSPNFDKNYDTDATTTVMMPEGESLNFQNGTDWPLSQHLKFSRQARAPMLYNVQIALSAIHNVRGITPLIQDITAEDIVNGYREKTIRLLWALVGKWGLTSLLDFQDLEWETKRLALETNKPFHHQKNDHNESPTLSEDSLPPYEPSKSKLKTWTRILAHKHNIPLSNFSTSFSNGRIFEAIVNEYEPFLLSSTNSATTSTPSPNLPLPLSTRLQTLGCSIQFSTLFSSPQIPSQDFVLATLTFLASRLLPPSRVARAAMVIQRAWRAYWDRKVMKRKQLKREIALEAVEVVKGKDMGGKGEIDGECGDVNCVDEVVSPGGSSVGDVWLSL